MANKLLTKVIDDLCSLPEGELKKLVQNQMADADMLEALIASLPDGHIIFTNDGTIKYINNAAFHLLPSDRRKKLRPGLKLSEMLIDKDVKEFLQAVFSGEEKAEAQDFAFQKGNEVRTERISFTFLTLPSASYVDVKIADITEEIMKETRLRRTESLASMTTMAAGIAHEIKNPLAAMKIHLQLMRKVLRNKGCLDEEGAERYLTVLDEEIDHLNKIAVDFLFAVRPMNIELRLGSLEGVINDLVTFLSPEADEKGIKVVAEIEKFLPRVELDARYLRQSLLNIVENAFSAMPGGGKLSIFVYLDGNWETIRVEDTGTGIDEEQLGKIFEPYFTTKASGTGLGLTVVYKVIKEHRGDIFVSSEPGKGTVFTIKLPVPASERKAIGDKEATNGDTSDC
ncbi:MAG: histidine kinase [Spirochaetes bacterium]|uniref:histidine kinase n=1 Tax=Candidatus Ornithospirochaeta stercoripullorum TaxID=2840899 RepID=A0A9D9E0J5_9SPIO|nr:histidine kinase [Candidatus Ornithospirochaeta stercoripullorum]